ncbi:MAG: GNAT family N-acetyltransferase [Bacteroidales bacterium]|jgi:diamine N-acetyltransferase|nr:GNAT family N-acetyltransferase [Bacteroidales bacterium]
MITLRAVEPEDLSLMYLWENDRTVWQASNTLVPFSRYQLRRYIESDPSDIHAHRQLRMMIDLHGTTPLRTVGAVDLFDFDPIHERAGLGILIASEDDRRQGFASEAIRLMIEYGRNVLFLHQIYCKIAASNTASIRLFERAGFKNAGRKKDWLKTSGGWEDELFLQLIIEENRG